MTDIRGASRMVVDAATGVTDVVEAMHRTIQETPMPVGRDYEPGKTRGITGLVYRAIRGGMQLTGKGLDFTLGAVAEMVPEGETSAQRDVLLSALNGVYGDYLAETQNELAIPMQLRAPGGRAPNGQPVSGKVLVLVHGLCMADLQFTRKGHDHGVGLADELGYTPVYLWYNTGLPVPDNGRRFATLLQETLDAWPVEVTELVVVGFSMGGLVARSAIAQGAGLDSVTWASRLDALVTLGTPHLGSPLAEGGHWIDQIAALSPYLAPIAGLAKRRSAGLHDLRHGAVLADSGAHVPLPEGVRCHAVAGTLNRSETSKVLAGDGLVPVYSALGRATEPERVLDFPPERRLLVPGASHLDLLDRIEVYEQLRAWLRSDGVDVAGALDQ